MIFTRHHWLSVWSIWIALFWVSVGFSQGFDPSQSLTLGDVQLIDELGYDIAEQRTIAVYEAVSPAVVSIATETFVRDFFLDVVAREGSGSGFIIDSSGLIITNYHVIETANNVEVILASGEQLSAEVIGVAPRSDLALLQVLPHTNPLPFVFLGDSDNIRVGQRTIAIGNPFGQFGQTLTTGVVSALNRSIEQSDGTDIRGAIQTDTAINRGNSGGPLLNSSGQVIGINTAIYSISGGNSGVGFAIPINRLKRVLPDLIQYGRYRNPSLGYRYGYRITPQVANILSLPVDTGLLIVELANNGSLKRAGVREANRQEIVGRYRLFLGGDILYAVDGTIIHDETELRNILENNYLIGDEVHVTLVRNGQPLDIVVTLQEE